MKNQLTNYSGYDGYQQRYTYNAQGHMVKRESKGNTSRQTLEAIATGEGESAAAASKDGGSDDDPDPYANASSSDSWSITTYVYDVTAPYYEVLSETTDDVTTAYEYGVERISAYEKISWSTLKTDYVYDGRGSVAQELTYNSSWYTFGGFLSNKGLNSYTYAPFGELLTGEGSGYRFNGEYFDSATGMLNLRARQYEPSVMRFSQRDIWHGKVETPTTQNRYLYCVNEPVGYYDRSGNRVDEDPFVPKKVTTSKVPVASKMPKSAYTMAQIARAEAAGNIGVNKTDLTTNQRKVVEAAEKTLREKTLNGSITASERDKIIKGACTAAKRETLTAWQEVNRKYMSTVGNWVIDFFDSNTGSIGGEFHNGILYGSGAITAGYNEVMLRGQSESRDYSSVAGIFSKISVINANGKIGLKSDDLGLFIKGVGDVLTASLIGGIQYKDNIGIQAKAKASVVSGRATIDFEVEGWQIELGVTGDAISIGAEIRVGYFEGAYELKAGASLGAGGGFLFRIKPPQ